MVFKVQSEFADNARITNLFEGSSFYQPFQGKATIDQHLPNKCYLPIQLAKGLVKLFMKISE